MTMQIYFCFKGNYDQYVKTREELEENQMKRFNWEQDQIAHMKVNEGAHVVRSFHYAGWMVQITLLNQVHVQGPFKQICDIP